VFVVVVVVVEFKFRNCPSARSTSATNVIGGDIDVFNERSFSVNDWVKSNIFTR
jgi:hypothetical protein